MTYSETACFIHCTKNEQGRFFHDNILGKISKKCFDGFLKYYIKEPGRLYFKDLEKGGNSKRAKSLSDGILRTKWTLFLLNVDITACDETQQFNELLRKIKGEIPHTPAGDTASPPHTPAGDTASPPLPNNPFSDDNSLCILLKDTIIIIHTNTKESDIPVDFRKEFEIIPVEEQAKLDTPASPPQDTSQGKKRNELFYNYNKQDKLTLFVKKDKFITLTENEAKLFLFLAKDRRTQEEIAEHVWEVYNKKDIHTKKGNAMELRNRLNKKCSKIGIENLISPLVDGCYCLNLEVEER